MVGLFVLIPPGVHHFILMRCLAAFRFENESNGHATPQSTRRTLVKQMRGSIDAPELRYGGNGQSLPAFLAKDMRNAQWGGSPFQVTRTAEDDLQMGTIGSRQILGNVPAGQVSRLMRIPCTPPFSRNSEMLRRASSDEAG